MKKFLLLSLTAFLTVTSFAQGHFSVAFTGNGQDHMNLNILTASIDGVNLQAGDEIAAFDGTICCGKVVLKQPINITNMNTFVAISASKTDDGLSNGYMSGNNISYKFWDSSLNEEFFLIASNYIDPNTALPTTAPKYTANASASVKLIGRINKVPVANAGIDQTVNENSIVTLDASASSDPDNDALTYTWTAPSGITLNSRSVAKPTFTSPEVASDTPYTFSLVVNDGLANSTTDQVIVIAKQVNKVPVANAGIDQSVNEGTTVTLDGSASTDADGNTLTYVWTVPSGISLSSTTTAKPSFTAPEVALNTQYTLSLVVNDGFANSISDQVVITVKQVNKVPVANAGIDKSINEGTIVTLDGSASTDSDGNTLTYSWTSPTGITFNSTTAAKPTFTAPEVASDTPFTFSLVVNDGMANSTTDQVIITVKQVNKVPVANAGNDQKVYEGLTGTLNGLNSSDGNGNTLTYSWTAPNGITLSSTTAAMPTFLAPEVSIDTQYTFGLIVNDGMANSSVDQVIITVAQTHFDVAYTGNGQDHMNLNVMKATFDGITLEAGDEIAVFDNTICCGKVVLTDSIITNNFNTFVTIDASRKDDGLSNGYSVGNIISYLFWDASQNAERKYIVAQYIDHSTSLVITAPLYTANASAFVKLAGITNIAPVANAGADIAFYKGETVTLDGSASSDMNNDALTFNWTAPTGITLNSATSSKPTFIAPNVTKDTTYTFSLVVSDGKVNSLIDQVKVTIMRKIYTQNIKFINGWNMISFNVIPSNINLKDIFQPLITKGTLVKIMDESGKSIENFKAFGGWINNIGNLSETEGYRVYVNGSDTLHLEGEAIKLPLDIPLVSGWNIISYPCSDAQNALTMVQPLINVDLLKKVMDETGNSIENFKSFGGWKNNIGNFLPGKGYKLFMNGSTTMSISSTILRSAALATASKNEESKYFTKIFKGNGSDQMSINLVHLEASVLKDGDELGVFDGKVCVGSATIGSEQIANDYISIPTSYNDGLEGTVNGFIPGNDITVQLYSSGVNYNLEIETLMGNNTYEKNGSLIAKVGSRKLTINQVIGNATTDKIKINCYPNPFLEEVSIDVENVNSSAISIEIFSITGQKIKQLYKGETKLVNFKWDGSDENGHKVNPGMYICKVNDSSRKIVFAKSK